MKRQRVASGFFAGILALVYGGIAHAQAPAGPEAKAQTARQISLVAGHNVVDAVDDVRETIGDLAGAMINASEVGEFAAWEPVRAPLQDTLAELDVMERRLDRKAEQTDSSWLNWMSDRDYSVTVKGEIDQLGTMLTEMGNLLTQNQGGAGMQVVTGHNVIGQVDDVRETVADLVNAIGSSGPEWGWFQSEDQTFPRMQAQLDEMEQVLDRKAEMSDTEWGEWVGGADYQTFVHGQVTRLGQMLNTISQSIKV